MAPKTNNLITVPDAANICGPGITPKLLFKLIDNGELPVYFIDTQIRVRLYEVDTALRNTQKTPQTL